MQALTSLDLNEARTWLKHFDEYGEGNLTDEQLENCEKMEWAINNAHKIRVMFSGMVDKVSENEVTTYWMHLRASIGEMAAKSTVH